MDSARFSLPVARTFPLSEVADAHRLGENGHLHGKLVLVADSPGDKPLRK
ncbi:zinc-binding dehydrogenase [Nocardia sp. NPDC059091]